MPTILCIDDDPYLTDLLRYGLARDGFAVVSAASGHEGLRLVQAEAIDLAILDVELPDMNRFAVLDALRAVVTIPIIVLTACTADEDIIAGLERGADDYVGKPFSMEVLAARVKAVLGRAPAQVMTVVANVSDQAPTSALAGALLDTQTNELRTPEGARVRLTPTESRILQLLLAHTGHALSSAHIIERIWGYTSDSNANVIKTHIRHLREKFAQLPGNPQPIRTLSGAGYMLS